MSFRLLRSVGRTAFYKGDRVLSILLLIAATENSNAGESNPQPQQAVEQSAQETEQDSDEQFELYMDQLYNRQFAEALATASKVETERENKKGRAVAAAMRGAAMLGLKRDKESTKLFAEADRLDPTESYASALQFDVALLSDNFGIAAAALDRLIARFPDVARDISFDYLRYFLRNEPKGEERRSEDRRIALARLGYGGDADYGDWLAYGAVEILIKRADVMGASELLPYIDEPQAVENLLIQKRYSTLWPKIETLAGSRLEKIRASSVLSAERTYAEAPDDPEKLQLLINALRHAGRVDEAILLRAKLPKTREIMAGADEQMGWAVNNVALALHEAGRAEEADQLFALLNDAPMEKEGWRVSMKINRLQLLVARGKFDKALPLVEPTAQAKGSPYAAQLVRYLRYCTLSGLGRKEEAAKLLPGLLQHAEDALGATLDGLLCAGDIDAAEKLALSSLKKESFHESFVRSLQAQPLTSDQLSVWDSAWQKLRQRPAISVEFQRLGRDMPRTLLPSPVKVH